MLTVPFYIVDKLASGTFIFWLNLTIIKPVELIESTLAVDHYFCDQTFATPDSLFLFFRFWGEKPPSKVLSGSETVELH